MSRMRTARSPARWVVVMVLVLLAGAFTTGVTRPDRAAAAPRSFVTVGKGGDSCSAPSVSQMSAFFRNTPYLVWGIYIGGVDRACSQPNLTRSWVTAVTGQGWALMPLWVGPQNPCLPGFDHFSTNTAAAYSQGKAQAKAAYHALIALGMAADSPITYDMESAASNSRTCINATTSFVRGWDDQLSVPPAQPSGLYTSTCGGFLDAFASISHPPDFVAGADYNGVISTGNLPCVNSRHWIYHQRHKQYAGGHNETWNGVTLNIDSDCANAPAVANAAYNGNNGCR